MKIAILADSYLLDKSTSVNGTQVQLYNIAKALAGIDGISVYYCAARKNKPAEKIVDADLTVHYVKAQNSVLTGIYNNFQYYALLESIQPDVVYQRGRSNLTYAAYKWCRKHAVRFVWASNGEDSLEFWKNVTRLKESNRPWYRKALLFLPGVLMDYKIHQAIAGANQVINQTSHQKQSLNLNYNKDGIILPSYHLPFDNNQYVKKNTVLWLASLTPAKQPELFIELARKFKDNDQIKFSLGGGTTSESFRKQINNLASDLENLEITGTVNYFDTFARFAQAKLFINTSKPKAEGVPNTFIQAMLCGTPIVSLHHNPNNWLHDYNAGICCDGDVTCLYDTVDKLMRNDVLRNKMSENAKAFALDKFASDNIVNQYLAVFSGSQNYQQALVI